MSIDYHVYCGPAFRCTFHKNLKCTTFKACDQTGCTREGVQTEYNFCPRCGHQINDYTTTEDITSVNHHEIAFEIEEVMRHVKFSRDDNIVYWISNMLDHDLPAIFNPTEMSGAVIQSQDLIDKHEKEFLRLFSKERKALDGNYDSIKLIPNILLVWQN